MAKKLKRRNSILEIDDEVVASFLGAPYNCKVIKIIDRHTYKLQTTQGTILPSVKWKDKTAKDRKGKITSPWYIIRTGRKTHEDGK